MKIKSNPLKLVISILLPFLAAFIGSAATTPSIPTWYAQLTKPSWNPPNWIFAPVWTTLYLLMGIAFYLIWTKGTSKDIRPAVNVYLFQLILNALWSIFFFGNQNPIMGLLIIVILWILIFLTITRFYKLNKLAGIILIPYFLWVSFAGMLNFFIFLLNP